MRNNLFTRQRYDAARLFIFLSSILYLLSSPKAHAQAGEWTWMKGSNTSGAGGVYGTQGVADAANNPPALYGAGPFTDHAGNFWMFGGGSYAALWKYEPSTNNWTWMKGPISTSQLGVYGTLGVGDANNYPGSRGFGFLTWVDTSGSFWLYGGRGYSASLQGYLSDLWKYDVATNEWTWMNGSDNNVSLMPVYGIKGVPAATNSPGGRFEVTCGWTDSHNRLWFFGGFDGYASYRDDVWMYDISTNEWTWMGGSNGQGQIPNWGTQGIFSAANTPGARLAYAHWKDADDNLWTFGGGYPDEYADLWKYDITLNQWVWMSGVNYVNYSGIQGPRCDLSIYSPKSRSENRAVWTDCCGKFWLFGGGDCNGDPAYNDLWVYDPAINKWSWINGDSIANPTGSYGTQGVSSPANKSPGKAGSATWIDDQQNLWLFGGISVTWTTVYNDLWRYVQDTTCHGCSLYSCASNSVQPVAFSSSDSFLCEKFCINFYDSSQSNPVAWQWIFPGGSPSSSTDQNPVNICYQTPGVFDVTLITTNANGNDTLTLYNYITVYPTPPFPSITQVDYTLTSSPASSYQWQFNSADIPGATNQSYTILQTGYYTVIISDANGCVNSTTVYVLISDIEEAMGDGSILIYPNPSSGSFIVEWRHGLMAGEVSIDIVNTLGQKVFSSEEKITTTDFSEGVHSDKKEIDLSDVARGVYFIEIKTESEFLRKKILIAD
ncbi:MAG TPA: kelch repeat-containing protein [Chitinophagales bacterium]|nr:kelch repeat-containing protein [Chitinophagales bacterium]